MKNTLLSLIAVVALGSAALAQTNSVISTNAVEAGKSFGSVEITFGGGGFNSDGESEVGVDFSISTNPLEEIPQIWVGLAQSLYWSPSVSGSTDLFIDWSQPIWKETLYANVGWSVGITYDDVDHYWRNGPELTLQYYVAENAFIYSGVNYDFVKDGENGFRYSFGIGLAF